MGRLPAFACFVVLALTLSACQRNTSAAFVGPWYDARERLVSPTNITVQLGPTQRCDWHTVALMTVGWPIGSPIANNEVRTFVRDPDGILGADAGSQLEPNTELPRDAVSTGYHHGEWQLWVVPSDDKYVYLAGNDRVERWPGGSVGCA